MEKDACSHQTGAQAQTAQSHKVGSVILKAAFSCLACSFISPLFCLLSKIKERDKVKEAQESERVQKESFFICAHSSSLVFSILTSSEIISSSGFLQSLSLESIARLGGFHLDAPPGNISVGFLTWCVGWCRHPAWRLLLEPRSPFRTAKTPAAPSPTHTSPTFQSFLSTERELWQQGSGMPLFSSACHCHYCSLLLASSLY